MPVPKSTAHRVASVCLIVVGTAQALLCAAVGLLVVTLSKSVGPGDRDAEGLMMTAGLGAVGVAMVVCGVWLWPRRVVGNRCPKCNYDRAGIAGHAKCPECGAMPAGPAISSR